MEIAMNVRDMIPDFAEVTSAIPKKVIQMKHQWRKLWIILNYVEIVTNAQRKMPTVHYSLVYVVWYELLLATENKNWEKLFHLMLHKSCMSFKGKISMVVGLKARFQEFIGVNCSFAKFDGKRRK